MIQELRSPSSQFGALVATTAAGATVGGLVSGSVNPLARLIGHWIDTVVRSGIPDPPTLLRLKWRGWIESGQYMLNLRGLGLNETFVAGLEDALRPRLSPEAEITQARRFRADLNAAIARIREMGYTLQDATKIAQLTEFLPGPSDLVRMAVREAWRDDVAARWGYDADMPPHFAEQMQRLGDTENWARLYWRAHWELPSVTLGTEMLHRGALSLEEFDELLRISDIPAEWRRRITQIAYRPYTRVDTRRMYRAGVLDETGVYQTYRDLGYDHEHALGMMEFTILDAVEEERTASKGDITRAYRLGRLDRATAREMLIGTGYAALAADLALDSVDATRENERIDTVVRNTRTAYLAGALSESDARVRLSGLGLEDAEVQEYMEVWGIERQSRMRYPPRTSLDDFFRRDIIGIDEYRSGLERLGYQEQAIGWYVDALLQKREEALERERERAQDEAEKLRLREEATAYQRERAALLVELRTIEAQITDVQSAIRARSLQYQADLAMARQRVTAEQLRAEYDADVAVLREQIDELSVEIRHDQAEIAEMEAERGQARLEIELLTDEALTAQGRAQIAEIQEQQAAIAAEIAALQAGIVDAQERIGALTEAAVAEEIRLEIAQRRERIDSLQTEIAEHRSNIAALARLALEVEPEQAIAVKRAMLDEQIAIASLQERIETLEDEIAAIRTASVDPETAAQIDALEREIAARRTRIAALRAESETLDEQIAQVRATLIDPERVAEIEALRERIVEIAADVERRQADVAAARAAIAELQARVNRRREQYAASLAQLRRAESVDAVEAAYRADIEAYQAQLATLRGEKAALRVEIAQLAARR